MLHVASWPLNYLRQLTVTYYGRDMLTLQDIGEAIKTLRAGQWPASLGPPPDAWNHSDQSKNRELCNRVMCDLERSLLAEDATPTHSRIES